MIKKMKAAWQRYLDKMEPVRQERAPAGASEFFRGTAAASPRVPAAPTPRPVHHTAPLVLRELRKDVAMEEAVARSYEEDLGPITVELLRDLDETFMGLLTDRDRTSTWTRVMFDRRTARNQQHVLVDVEHLWRDDIPEAERRELVCASIRARALHASDPDEQTGLIPVMAGPSYMIEEEDTA